MKGLVVVDPESSYYVTPLQVTEMFVNGERYADNYQIKSDTTFVLKEYENNLTFNFTSLEYEKPDLIRYQYKLVGKDSVWNWLRGENEVSFFNEYDEAISPSEWATDVINGYGGQVSWGSVKAGFHGFRDCISVRNHTRKKVVIKKPTRPLKTPIYNFLIIS